MEFKIDVEKLLHCDADGFGMIKPDMIHCIKTKYDPIEEIVTALGQASAEVSSGKTLGSRLNHADNVWLIFCHISRLEDTDLSKRQLHHRFYKIWAKTAFCLRANCWFYERN